MPTKRTKPKVEPDARTVALDAARAWARKELKRRGQDPAEADTMDEETLLNVHQVHLTQEPYRAHDRETLRRAR